MKRIAITGLSGVIGKNLIEEIDDSDQILDLYHSKKSKNKKIGKNLYLDLKNTNSIKYKLEEEKPDVIIHLAAITHIDKCEKDKKSGKKGEVWKVNVESVKEIVNYCKKNNCKLIFLSTECVFDGKKKSFKEADKTNPINWYGTTKNEAEKIITRNLKDYAILRSVVTYSIDKNQKTIYSIFLKKLSNGKKFKVANDVKFTPTLVTDITKGINTILNKELNGIFHVASNEPITPYEFARLIARSNRYESNQIIGTTLDDIYGIKNTKLRLKNSALDSRHSSKILGFSASNPGEVL